MKQSTHLIYYPTNSAASEYKPRTMSWFIQHCIFIYSPSLASSYKPIFLSQFYLLYGGWACHAMHGIVTLTELVLFFTYMMDQTQVLGIARTFSQRAIRPVPSAVSLSVRTHPLFLITFCGVWSSWKMASPDRNNLFFFPGCEINRTYSQDAMLVSFWSYLWLG